tara:strand:+ start:39527 stop:39871 length:345 start_codon:yes stop_codon:yes gene_type:complete
MNIIIESIGIFGSCCIALSLFPQTFKIIKTKSMDDIAIPFVLLTMGGAGCQLIYGIYNDILPMIIANICVLVNTIILLVYKCYFIVKTLNSDSLNVNSSMIIVENDINSNESYL